MLRMTVRDDDEGHTTSRPVQVEAWKAAMTQSRHAIEALTGAAAAPSGDLSDWDSSSAVDSETGTQPGDSASADPNKPTLELRASLGEFAIFLSGRVAKDWWPEEVDSPAPCACACSHYFVTVRLHLTPPSSHYDANKLKSSSPQDDIHAP